jgi:hypothetical protein
MENSDCTGNTLSTTMKHQQSINLVHLIKQPILNFLEIIIGRTADYGAQTENLSTNCEKHEHVNHPQH